MKRRAVRCYRFSLIAMFAGVACSQSPVKPTAASTTPTASTPAAPAFVLTGDHTLTVTASPRCARVVDQATNQLAPFPDSVRVRSYDVQLTQQNSDVSLVLETTYGPALFRGSVDGAELRFSNVTCGACTCDELFSDEFAPGEVFALCGSGLATVDPPEQITGAFDGDLEYYRSEGDGHTRSLMECRATDHRFTLTRK
jgi:hypothetical protein